MSRNSQVQVKAPPKKSGGPANRFYYSSKPKVQLVRQPRGQKRRPRANDFTSALQRVVTSALNRPLFLATLLLSVVFLTTFTSIDEGPISTVLPKTSTNQFVVWARTNVDKFIGGVVFLPAIVDSPARYRLTIACGVAAWIFLVPEASQKEYAIQAISLHLFIHLRNPSHRVVILILVFSAYVLGFLTLKTSEKKSTTPSGANKNQ